MSYIPFFDDYIFFVCVYFLYILVYFSVLVLGLIRKVGFLLGGGAV